MKKSYQAEWNGYSNYQKESLCASVLDGLTVTIRFTPYTYESCESGLLCAFGEDPFQGLVISIGKGGVVSVKLGLGKQVVTLQSLVRHLDYQKPNVITVGFWGEAGWCDLCVNGQLSNRKQFPRHSQLYLPEGTCYIGRYVDGKEYTESSPPRRVPRLPGFYRVGALLHALGADCGGTGEDASRTPPPSTFTPPRTLRVTLPTPPST